MSWLVLVVILSLVAVILLLRRLSQNDMSEQ